MDANGRTPLGTYLEQIRTNKGLSRQDVADRMPGQVRVQYIYRWEKEARVPSLDTLAHLSTALEVDLTDLLSRIGGEGRLSPEAYIALQTYQRMGDLIDAVRESTGGGIDIDVGGDMQVNKADGEGGTAEGHLGDVRVTKDEDDKGPDEEE